MLPSKNNSPPTLFFLTSSVGGPTQLARLVDYTAYTSSNIMHSWSIILDTTSCTALMTDAQGYTHTPINTHREREREREREIDLRCPWAASGTLSRMSRQAS